MNSSLMTRSRTGLLLLVLVCFALAPQISAQSGAAKADSLLAAQKYAKALPLLLTATKQFPDSGRLWFNLGLARHMELQFGRAIKAYLRADSLGMTKALVHYNLGCATAMQGKKDESFEWLTSAVNAGFNNVASFKTDPDLDTLRTDPRFAELIAGAEAVASPCESDPTCGQLDFWVGIWNVYDTLGNRQATDTIVKEMRGCLIVEHFNILNAFRGTSFNFYDRKAGGWRQHWVDQTGTVVLFSGNWKDGAMRFVGEMTRADGNTILQRMVLTPNEDGSVHQLVENSTDDGETWLPAFDLLYVKAEMVTGKTLGMNE